MPADQAELARHRDMLKSKIDVYATSTVDSFVRPELGTQLTFEPLRPAIESLIEVSKGLSDAPLDVLPYPLLQKALNAYGTIESRMQELKTFDVVALSTQNQNPVGYRQNIIQNFDASNNTFWEQIAPVVSFIGATSLKRDSNLLATRQLMEQAQGALRGAQTSQDELEKIVAASREAAANVGASRHATLFAEEASAYERVGGKWLWATGLSAAVTLAAAVANYVFLDANTGASTTGSSIQVVIAKVFVFSMLLSATVWCGKNYRAARHNHVVNKHRQNALTSFQTFIEGASDAQTKNAVLIQASQSIFAPQSSGYISGEPDAAGPSQFIELVRTVSQPAK